MLAFLLVVEGKPWEGFFLLLVFFKRVLTLEPLVFEDLVGSVLFALFLLHHLFLKAKLEVHVFIDIDLVVADRNAVRKVAFCQRTL